MIGVAVDEPGAQECNQRRVGGSRIGCSTSDGF